MTTHLVLLKPRAGATPSERRDLVSAFRHAVQAIPTIREVRIGRRVTHGARYEQGMPDAADFVVLLNFDDVAGLQTYLDHDAHADLGVLMGKVGASLVYDFEVGDLDILGEYLEAAGQ